MKHPCDLQTCFLCKFCLKEWRPAIAAHRQNFAIKKGQVLFREGDPVSGIYFVNEGKLKVHKKWGQDKELIIRFASKGAIAGHRGIGASGLFPVSATALEPSKICFVSLDFFRSTLTVNHDLTYQLLLFFASELQESERKMRDLAHMPVKGRLAEALISLQTQFGTTSNGYIDINLSRQDLASLSGTTYETVFRILGELTDEGAVSLSGKSIRILDKAKLDASINTGQNAG